MNQNGRKKVKKLGQDPPSNQRIRGGLFSYHGNESSVPPVDIATDFANRFPLSRGMPGPSFTWSAFADSYQNAIQVIDTERVLTVVTERLDESLVILARYMNWSLADVIHTVPRKALSKHPRHSQWPKEPIRILNEKLHSSGEFKVYKAANESLTRRIDALKKEGINVAAEVNRLRNLRTRVTELCHSEEYLDRYKSFLQTQKLNKHQAANKLRDAEDKYVDDGHLFSWNGELLYSYDVCGNCEAHALELGYSLHLSESWVDLPLLKNLPKHIRDNNPDFIKCPND